MLASVHFADVGRRKALGALRRRPKTGSVPGLRQADVALAAPLGGAFLPSLDARRVGLVAFWDDDESLDAFLADHPLAQALADGWHVRLEPLRAHGSWPGLPEDTPTGRAVTYDGPAVVVTIGRLRLSQAVRFLKASARAEERVLEAPGLTWATGFGRPPLVGTLSLWEDSRSLATYAYGASRPAHPDAIAEGERKAFHHQQAFIRFRPYASRGHLDGRNPLREAWLTPA
jgi:hypothetical protein